MMIRTETFEINGRSFTRTYSDAGRYIVGGVPEGQYTEATDPTDLGRTYTEGDIMPDEGGATEEERALTRYANELTGENDPDLVSATETLITKFTEE